MGRPRSPARRSWPPNLHQNTAGYFYWRDPSTGKSFGLGRDKADALAEAKAANAKRAAEEPRSLIQRIDTTNIPTLAVWVEEWIGGLIQKMAPKTIKNYRSALRELVARCGHLSVRDITPKMIADILEIYATTNRKRMAVLIRETALELFRVAEERGNIEVGKNPVAATKTEKAKVKRLRLSLEEFMAIYGKQTKPWAKRSMELALITSQRRGDVAIMRRADIVDGHLQVDQGKSGGVTKLGIPLTLGLAKTGWTLREVIDRCRTPGLISPFLVHHRTPGGHHEAGEAVGVETITSSFAEARDLAKLEGEEGRTPPTFHEIRSLAIRLYKEQYGKEFAQALAGHKNLKTTLLYTDPRDSEAVRIMIPDPGRPTLSTNIE